MSEAQREAQRRYYQRNKAKVLERARAWAKANPEKVRAHRKKWNEANKAYYRQWHLDRKAGERNAKEG